jgi:putative ABC transport system substrate-binding protein
MRSADLPRRLGRRPPRGAAGCRGEQPGRVYRLGLLSPGGPSTGFLVLIEGLRELGYVEGQNLVVEGRYAEGKTDRLPGLARDLVRIPVDVIVAVASAVDAAKDATKTIPIVMGVASDPVGRGFVSSLIGSGVS